MLKLPKRLTPHDVNWDFSPVDRLPAQPAARGRLYRGPSHRGATLLFIHGAFHGAWCWSRYLPFFDDRGLAVAALDLRGHGALPQDQAFGEQGVWDMAQDAVAAVAMLEGEIILVGHSFGALVALTAAREISVRATVLIAPAPPAGIGDVRGLTPFVTGALVAPPPEERARKWFLQGYEGDLGPYLDRLRAESPALLNAAGVFSVDTPAIPMLCVGGSLDRSVFHRAGQDEAIAAGLGAELRVIAGASHCLMLDAQWQESAGAIMEWLRRIGAVDGP